MESSEVYDVFEEVAPFLVYIRDFWIGRANCPLFVEQVLLSAESLSLDLPIFLRDNLTQQWGVPLEHHSSAEGVHKFERFPAIPIPFCLRFREGSAMMRMVSSKDLDVFASLRGKESSAVALKATTSSPPLEIQSSTSVSKAFVAPPRLIRRNRELENLKADASSFLASPRSAHSKDSDNELLSGFPSAGSAPVASSSTKVSIGKGEPKSKTTVKVVEDSKADRPLPAGMAYKRIRLPPRSRKNTSIASKGKARQIVVTDEGSTSNEVESEDEAEDEDIAPPPKRLKTTSSISASLPRRPVKRVTVPKRVSKAAAKPVPERSPNNTFQPVLLADSQGRLRLPEQSTARVSFDSTRDLFLRSILDLQNAGEDPIVVLEALKAAEPNRRAITLNEWTLMATLFRWPSPFNLSGLDFDNRTPGEWIELLRSIHSGESTAHIDEQGHLVESSPPPDSATKALEGLKEVEKGSADEGTSSQVGGSVPMELDLPTIESLAERTLSPEKGAEPAQTL
ncbi:hypothetical protein LENED_010611 [Lentinula edodes]|uniref:Uncharacterized protein n=1 Tax=Lentinula edodes TaxID=5353 RepID=A0A1Q3EMX2_LENED|nr:hypothetical protein LENED_010611 [Lentinula edodes]